MSRFNLLIAAVLTREEIKTLSQFAKSLTRSIIRGSQSRGARKIYNAYFRYDWCQ
jgi:hypothetical protein